MIHTDGKPTIANRVVRIPITRPDPQRCAACHHVSVTTHDDGSQSCGYCAVNRYRSYH
jgi:hypothetical protein